MKILIVNFYDGLGGAAMACKRLHLALLENGHDSKLLLLSKKADSKQVFSFLEKQGIIPKAIRKIKGFFYYYLYNRPYDIKPKGHYLHSSAFSVFDISNHELYNWADIVNLHWVGGFLDFPSFFSKNNSKTKNRI